MTHPCTMNKQAETAPELSFLTRTAIPPRCLIPPPPPSTHTFQLCIEASILICDPGVRCGLEPELVQWLIEVGDWSQRQPVPMDTGCSSPRAIGTCFRVHQMVLRLGGQAEREAGPCLGAQGKARKPTSHPFSIFSAGTTGYPSTRTTTAFSCIG